MRLLVTCLLPLRRNGSIPFFLVDIPIGIGRWDCFFLRNGSKV
jgi:hypothetical protein